MLHNNNLKENIERKCYLRKKTQYFVSLVLFK